jgi:hypothetical protein
MTHGFLVCEDVEKQKVPHKLVCKGMPVSTVIECAHVFLLTFKKCANIKQMLLGFLVLHC